MEKPDIREIAIIQEGLFLYSVTTDEKRRVCEMFGITYPPPQNTNIVIHIPLEEY